MHLTSNVLDLLAAEGGEPRSAPSGFQIPWEVLSSDAGAYAMLVDQDGRVDIASEMWARQLNLSHVSGCLLADLLGEDMAMELLELGSLARAEESPKPLLHMVHGRFMRTTLRSVPGVHESTANGTLMTSCTLREGMQLDDTPLGECHHLGDLRHLTEREFELLFHLGRAASSEDAARLMHRSVRTVEWHRASLGEKLGCRNRIELARVAISSGIVAASAEMIPRLYRAAVLGRARRRRLERPRMDRSEPASRQAPPSGPGISGSRGRGAHANGRRVARGDDVSMEDRGRDS